MQDNEEDAKHSFRPIEDVQGIPPGCEAVGMQPHSQHVHAPPRKGDDDAAKYVAEVEKPRRKPPRFPGVKHGQLPQHNH